MGIPAVMLYTLMWAACLVFVAITLRTAETASPATTMWWAVVWNANFSVETAKGLRLVLDGFADSGAGRYIGGLIPDVIRTILVGLMDSPLQG